MTKLKDEFLPLGSIVTLSDTETKEQLFLVIARAIGKSSDEEIAPRYKVVRHPYGDIPSEEIFSIGITDIQDVIFKGFENDKDKEFLDDLLYKIENFKPSEAKVTIREKKEEKVVTEEEITIDPFYKFR